MEQEEVTRDKDDQEEDKDDDEENSLHRTFHKLMKSNPNYILYNFQFYMTWKTTLNICIYCFFGYLFPSLFGSRGVTTDSHGV